MSTNPSSRRAWRNINLSLLVGALQVCGALLLLIARKQGMIDIETTKRGVMILVGLGVAAYGNWMPKMLEGPSPQSRDVAALRQSINRVGGWAMMLGGIAFAVIGGFMPRSVSVVGSIVAVGAGMAVMVGHGLWRVFQFNRRSRSAAHGT